VKHSRYRLIAGVVATIALLVGAVIVMDPGAGGDEPANRAATAAYLDVQNRLGVAQEGALVPAKVAARRYADSVLGRCHGALMGAPIPPAGSKSRIIRAANNETELSREILNAVAMATEPQSGGQGQLRQLKAEATSVEWHNKQLNTLVSLRAAEELAWERLAAPDVCRDLKLWAQHGYGTIPATSRAFLKRGEEIEQLVSKRLYGTSVQVVGSEPVTKMILMKLLPYENSIETKRLSVLVGRRELKVQQGYTAIALSEASRLYHGLGFDYCGRGGRQRCH
jgi:hypothetical protein